MSSNEEQESLSRLIRTGRLPISAKNVEVLPLRQKSADRRSTINAGCRDADLVIAGFDGKLLKKQKSALFQGYEDVGSVLFVNTTKEIELVGEDAPEEEPTPDEPECGGARGARGGDRSARWKRARSVKSRRQAKRDAEISSASTERSSPSARAQGRRRLI